MSYILFLLIVLLRLTSIIFDIYSVNHIILAIIIYLIYNNKFLVGVVSILSLMFFGYFFYTNNLYIMALFIWCVFLITFKQYVRNNDIMYINISILLITIIEISIEKVWFDWKLILVQIIFRVVIMNLIYFILNREEINEKL